jgi:hypothetical protein
VEENSHGSTTKRMEKHQGCSVVESIFKPKRVRLLFINTTLMIGVATKSLASSVGL